MSETQIFPETQILLAQNLLSPETQIFSCFDTGHFPTDVIWISTRHQHIDQALIVGKQFGDNVNDDDMLD